MYILRQSDLLQARKVRSSCSREQQSLSLGHFVPNHLICLVVRAAATAAAASVIALCSRVYTHTLAYTLNSPAGWLSVSSLIAHADFVTSLLLARASFH